jgi:hypothetical protein
MSLKTNSNSCFCPSAFRYFTGSYADGWTKPVFAEAQSDGRCWGYFLDGTIEERHYNLNYCLKMVTIGGWKEISKADAFARLKNLN